jgi:hypothetical protein
LARADLNRAGDPATRVEAVREPAYAARRMSTESRIAGTTPRAPWVSRLAWFVLAAMPLAVLTTARTLTPNPAGHSTHTQLGLPPCGFLVMTGGCPCPGCGLTTAFAHLAHFDPFGAASANPFGIPLFLVSLFTIPVAIRGFARGDAVLDTLDDLHVEKVSAMLAVSGILIWVVRVGAHMVLRSGG